MVSCLLLSVLFFQQASGTQMILTIQTSAYFVQAENGHTFSRSEEVRQTLERKVETALIDNIGYLGFSCGTSSSDCGASFLLL